ncbi:MAG TPA: RNA methyltransferase, partial [Candidatus Babeliaceae bacterium]|nr:RNA methyltransferase [Candidatus Babeliaceae bacterium]
MATNSAHVLVFGIHPIVEILKARKRKLHAIYTTKPTPKSWNLIEPLLPKTVPIQYVNRDILNKLAGTTDHQGVVGYASPLPIRKKFFNAATDKFLVMVDGVQDPRNLGALLRSAYCTGVNGVILSKKNSAPLNATALKSSAGLAEHLEIYEAQSAHTAVQELKKAG